LSGKHEKSLASSAQYQAVKKRALRGQSGILFYANAERLMQIGMQMSGQGEQAKQMIDMIGLNTLKAIGAGLHFKNSQVVESLYIYMPGERTGILGKILPSKPASTNLEKYIPEDLIAFRHSHFELEGLVEAVLEALQMFAPRQYQQFTQMEEQFNSQLGLNLRKDVVYNIGSEYLFSLSFSGGLIPDVGIQLSLKDVEVFTNSIKKLMQMIPKKHRYEFLWNGYNFHYFNVSTMRNPVPIAPTFVIDGNRMLITLYPEMAKNLIIQKNGHFPKDMVTYLDGYEHTDIEYLNIEKLVVPMYRTALPFIQSMIPRSEVPIEFALLPSANTLEKYVTNAMQVWFTDETGMCLEVHSPFGITPLVGLAAAMAPRRSYDDHKYDEKMPFDDKLYDDKKDPVDIEEPVVEKDPGVDLSSELLGVQDLRTWKNTEKKTKASLYYASSNLKVHVFCPLPANTLSYGNFQLDASDNSGNKLNFKPVFGFQKNAHKKIDSYSMKNLARDKGMKIDLEFATPSRDAKSINISGSFEIKTADSKTLTLKGYGELRKNLYVTKDIPGLVIQFTKESKEKTINVRISGDPLQVKTIYAKKGEKLIKSTGWSSYKSKGDTVSSYWFREAISDDADIYIEYADNLKMQKVIIDIKEHKLP
jgi:hypothetical protein